MLIFGGVSPKNGWLEYYFPIGFRFRPIFRCYVLLVSGRVPGEWPTFTFKPSLAPPSTLSHEKNPAVLSIESWLVNRDPYNGLL